MNPHGMPQAYYQNQQIYHDQPFIISNQEQYANCNNAQHIIENNGNYYEVSDYDPMFTETLYIPTDDQHHHQTPPVVQYVDTNMIPLQQFNENGLGDVIYNEYIDNTMHVDDGSGICYVTMTPEEYEQQQMNQPPAMYYNNDYMEQVQYISEDQMGLPMQQMIPVDINLPMQDFNDHNMQQMPVEFVVDQDYHQPMQVYNQPDNVLAEGVDFDSPEDMERRLEEAYAAEGKQVEYIGPEDLERAGYGIDDFNSLTEEQLNTVLELKHHFEAHENANLEVFEQNKERLEVEFQETEAKRSRMTSKSAVPLLKERRLPKIIKKVSILSDKVSSLPSNADNVENSNVAVENFDHETAPSTSQPENTNSLPQPKPKRKLYKDVISFGHLRIVDEKGREYFFSKKELVKIGVNPATMTDDALNDLYEKAIGDRLAASRPQVKVVDPPKQLIQEKETTPSENGVIRGFKIGDSVIVADDNQDFEATIRYKKVTATSNLFKVQYTHGRFEWVDESRISKKPRIPEMLVPNEMIVAAQVINKEAPTTTKSVHPKPLKTTELSTVTNSSTTTRSPSVPAKSFETRPAVKLIQNQQAEAELAMKSCSRKRLHPESYSANKTAPEPQKPSVNFNCLPCGKNVTQSAYSFLVIRIPACVDCAKRTVAVHDIKNLEMALQGACSSCTYQKSRGNL